MRREEESCHYRTTSTMREDNRDEEKSSTNVFVKFLPPEVDDACLQELFAPFGRIESAKVMVDPQTWRTLGFGYISLHHQSKKHTTNKEKRKQKD